jgi:hypothetical protein
MMESTNNIQTLNKLQSSCTKKIYRIFTCINYIALSKVFHGKISNKIHVVKAKYSMKDE